MSRTTPSKEITRVSGSASALARFAEADTSLHALDAYRVLPRVKLIQGMSDESLKERFGEGSAVLRPGDAILAKKNEVFEFVPLHFYPEFTKVADRRDKGRMVVERSFDMTSELAKKARNWEQRWEVYPEDINVPDAQKPRKFRYIEHLRFPGLVYGDNPLNGTPVVMSFEKAEFQTGMNLIQAIKLRKERTEDGKSFTVPLYLQVWTFTPKLRTNGDKKWWGTDFNRPPAPYVRDDDMDLMKAQHEELVELYKKQRIVVDGDDNEDEEPAAASETKF